MNRKTWNARRPQTVTSVTPVSSRHWDGLTSLPDKSNSESLRLKLRMLVRMTDWPVVVATLAWTVFWLCEFFLIFAGVRSSGG